MLAVALLLAGYLIALNLYRNWLLAKGILIHHLVHVPWALLVVQRRFCSPATQSLINVNVGVGGGGACSHECIPVGGIEQQE